MVVFLWDYAGIVQSFSRYCTLWFVDSLFNGSFMCIVNYFLFSFWICFINVCLLEKNFTLPKLMVTKIISVNDIIEEYDSVLGSQKNDFQENRKRMKLHQILIPCLVDWHKFMQLWEWDLWLILGEWFISLQLFCWFSGSGMYLNVFRVL